MEETWECCINNLGKYVEGDKFCVMIKKIILKKFGCFVLKEDISVKAWVWF